jgi:acetyl-CoA C-acetyltransferase
MVATAREVRRVAILGGDRIPFARAGSRYAGASNQDMLTTVLDGLADRFGLRGQRLGEVVAGAVLKHSRDFNLTRECVLGSTLSSETPAYDVQQACGTGLQAVLAVADKIALGIIDVGVAGGVDTASDVPVAVDDRLRRTLLDISRARSAGAKIKAARRLRPGYLRPELPRNAEPRTRLSMGEHAALTAVEWEIGRAEQDALALASHQRLAAAYDTGFFSDLVTPYRGLERDENLRPDTSLEKLSRLRPVFGNGDTATMTAGNSTPLTDGASVVLLSSDDWASQRDLPVLGYLAAHETAAVDYVGGREGLLMAPAYAVPRMLDRAGLSLGDLDFMEMHEAFASQVLATLKAWEDPIFCRERLGRDEPLGSLERDRLNVVGSSLAAGHPFAATGGRIVATLATLVSQRADADPAPVRGAISICAAGGQGITALIER